MHSSIILLSAFLSAVMASPQSTTPVALGGTCTSSSQWANGASCYAVNSMAVTLCGNFSATCSSDSQCAFNTCVSGSCEGVLSSSSATLTTIPTTTSSIPSSTATSTTIPLGASCTTSAQCANGASCYAVNSMEVTLCGNQGATCTSDSQCAFSACVSGSCNGVLSSTSTSSFASSFGKTSSTIMPTTSKASGSRSNVTVTSTSTGVPAGFTTSVTVINGVTSSVLVNSVGATTSFGAVATSISVSTQASGAGRLVADFSGVLAVVGGFAMLL
ncbi:uncharacterized protein LY89DRAFT_787003 [Mollisia scopiformis]|uniref:Uncharacterized protein n=1 Tax=Mollisia scopiformis TaxID=149040 RepID=A0A194WTY0_MOLSC|nr:uncharacterized protein LY89DRAFT_787003 [Mollisia scopiformis]KUJ11401.1 hypothetical protein LY89DRAFT_787003 [Mollisia scopiformis]